MITTQLLRPESIVVVGASNNVHKPGGAILKNLICNNTVDSGISFRMMLDWYLMGRQAKSWQIL